MKEIKCTSCRQCNHKGKPSVMKGSMFCLRQRGVMPSLDDSSPVKMIIDYLNMVRMKGKKTSR